MDMRLLKRIMGLALPFKGLFRWALALTILASFLAAVQPWFYQHVIDNYIVKPDLKGLTLWSAIILGMLIFQAVLGFANSYLSEKIGQNVIFEMRSYVYRHLMRLRLGFYDKTPVGTAVTRTVSDIETISELFAAGLITIAGDIFQIVVILICMFWMNWKMALISLSVLPFLMWAANIFRKGVRDSFQDVRTQVSRLNAFLQEHITGMAIVQMFNRQPVEMDRFREVNALHRDANVRGIFYYAVFFPVVELIVAATLALLVMYGSTKLMTHEVQIGQITAFIMFINLFFRPVRAIADRFNNIQMGMVAAERIFQLIDDEENTENSGPIKDFRLRGEIEFRNVWFAYQGEEWVIRDLSFHIRPGQVLAIVGATGSGKTTLINLISRFYTHSKGEILIDGQPIEQYDLAALRQQVAVVLQDVFLFSGSIMDNIRLKNGSITDGQILDSAKLIGAYDFIKRLPGQFDFNVMERGLSLSLGQRQLVSFIRALAVDPALIVLDEATSSIDSETELLIRNATEKLLENRTAIVIAHRLSTIQHADKIMVMEKGSLLEMGSHEELMAAGGKYARMYNKQLEKMAG
jgi:ATP-binding cassette subfamily B protein